MVELAPLRTLGLALGVLSLLVACSSSSGSGTGSGSNVAVPDSQSGFAGAATASRWSNSTAGPTGTRPEP